MATTAYIKVNSGSENIYVATGSKSDTENTITYNAATNTITLKGYTGGDIKTNVANLKLACSAGASTQKATGSESSTGNVLSSAATVEIAKLCSTAVTTSTTTTTTTATTNPNTLDPITAYIALAVFSLAALIARKFYYAKH